MVATFFDLEFLAWCPFVGLIMVAMFCLHFVLMVAYAIVAECCNYPMPLDDRYLIGKINTAIMCALMIGGLIFLII